MLEPPSKRLQSLLADYQICTPRDLRRCRGRVRRLAYDLPAFDSVWIDALVQARKLTSFQAWIIESGEPERLQVGPCLLIDRLGHGQENATFLARHIKGNERYVLKSMTLPLEMLPPAETRLAELIKRFAGKSHPGIIVPHAKNSLISDEPDQRRLVVMSRFVPGPPLGELLVRRGRFHSGVVVELGRHIIDSLARLEECGLVHGDISLRTIRMPSTGIPVLVETGIRAAVYPELTSNSVIAPDRYDGIAPELIGTGQHATVKSDLYAVGCLLWQLLAGRPPFPTGDPLAKLAAHQTKSIDDVREWAPDTPAFLADSIVRFTQHNPDERVESMRELLAEWGPPRRSGGRVLARFRSKFDDAVGKSPATNQKQTPSRITVMLVLMMMLAGLMVPLFHQGAWMWVRAHIPNRFVGSSGDNTAQSDGKTNNEGSPKEGHESRSNQHTSTLLPFPPADRNGIIRLEPGARYSATDINIVGALTITGRASQKSTRPYAKIIIDNQSLVITADQVLIENVCIQRQATNNADLRNKAVLVLVRSQDLTIRNTVLSMDGLEHDANREHQVTEDTQHSHAVFVAWKLNDASDPTGQRVSLQNNCLVGRGTAVYFSEIPLQVSVSNCLKLGGGPFLSLAQMPKNNRRLNVSVDRSTFRRTGPLLRIGEKKTVRKTGTIDLKLSYCVFDLQPSLIEWTTVVLPKNWQSAITVDGAGALVNSSTRFATQFHPLTENRLQLDSSTMQVEGLVPVSGPINFHGPFGLHIRNSTVSAQSHQVPQIGSRHSPGIIADLLPVHDGDWIGADPK